MAIHLGAGSVVNGKGSDMRPVVRPLTDAEVESLEQALGNPVDRNLVAQRMSQIIGDIVRLAIQPKLPDYRDNLRRLARQGRLWLREIAEHPIQATLRGNTNLEQLQVEVTRFCDQVDVIRQLHGAGIKAGAPRRRLLLQVFIGELIGIAKRAGVPPSTPGRAVLPTKPPPPFYRLVKAALSIGEEIVLSSSLSERQKRAAQSVFVVDGDEALVKQIETVRGRISDYHPSPHGLLERPKC
jgi:hypothetical protein